MLTGALPALAACTHPRAAGAASRVHDALDSVAIFEHGIRTLCVEAPGQLSGRDAQTMCAALPPALHCAVEPSHARCGGCSPPHEYSAAAVRRASVASHGLQPHARPRTSGHLKAVLV